MLFAESDCRGKGDAKGKSGDRGLRNEEARIGEELRANILRDVEFVNDDDNEQYCEKNRKIG